MSEEPKHYPPGSPEALAAYRAMKAEIDEKLQRGRDAIFDAQDWRPEGGLGDVEDSGGKGGKGGKGGGDDDDFDDSDTTGEPDTPEYDHIKIPRIHGKVVRMVPITMTDDAPITCLGKQGGIFWYLSPLGELVGLEAGEHGQAHIEGLWSPKIEALHRAFPQFDQQRKWKGFAAQYARAAMMRACGLKGIFDAHDRVRGLGCWKGDSGELIQHLGDRILVSPIGGETQEYTPGEIGPYVYPGRPPMLPPKAASREAAATVLSYFRKWNFARGDLDARLLLGQQGAMILGAAIDWRPMAFLTGDAGTGKSTLQRLIRALFPKRLISTVDATEAALRALLGQDALAVSFDEIEADAGNDKAQNVMKLARTSASGDDAHRSGSDQVARSFTLRGSFLFSAIVPPPMQQQDMQRFAFLRLQTLTAGQVLDLPGGPELRELGCAIVGRITENWPRWEKTLAVFVAELQKRKHEHRGATQFGTMLAAAHLLLEDREPDERDFTQWCDPLHRDGLFEYENSEPAWLQVWRHLMSAQPEVWRSHGFPTVGETVRRYLKAADTNNGEEMADMLGRLRRAGLTIVRQRQTGRLFLAIPPRHQSIAAIFRGTNFQNGAWGMPLRNAPKVDGPPDPPRGVLHVDKVPALERQKCPMFWLDGRYLAAGEWQPIFEREAPLDETDLPEQTLAERTAAFYAAVKAATTTTELQKIYDRALPLRNALHEAGEDADADLAEAFNARWIEIEDGK